MLAHLSYVSRRTQLCTEQEIERIFASATYHNPSLEVTGVLIYSDEKFFQYVEGEYRAITLLYDKIKLDPRHSDVALLSMGPIKVKGFANWSMGRKKIQPDELEVLLADGTTLASSLSDLAQHNEAVGQKIQDLLARFV
jgi:hypothetical protein